MKKTDGVWTKKRYAEINKYLKEVASDLKTKVNEDMSVEDFIEYELLAQEKLYKKHLKGNKSNFNFPTVEQAVTTATFGSYTKSSSFENYMDSLESQFYNIWDSNVREGYLLGTPTQKIVRDVVGYQAKNAQLAQAGAMHQFKNSVMANTRTALQAMANDTRKLVMQKNEELFDGYEWVATLDRRSCLVCGSLNGKIEKKITDFGEQPPVHFNCLTENTFVSTCSPISRIFRRAYKGKVYRIRSSSGYDVTVTPNHPILTDRGFVGAQFLNIGDKIVINNGFETINIYGENKDNRKSTIKDIFSSLVESGSVTTCSMPLSTKDFHSDFSDNEVNVVKSQSELSDEVEVLTFKNKGKSIFVNGRYRTSRNLSCASKFMLFFSRFNSTFRSLMCIFCKFHNFFNRRVFHSLKLLFTSISHKNVISSKETNHLCFSKSKFICNSCNSNTFIVKFKYLFNRWIDLIVISRSRNGSLMENISDDVFGNTELARNILNRNSVFIKFDNIIAIDIVEYSGHVYNLETVDNFYFSNDIISHNCRCVIVPKISGYDELDDDVRASENGYTDMSYNAWLKSQPEDVQREVLGKTRFEIFQQTGSVGEFVNDGKVIPVKTALFNYMKEYSKAVNVEEKDFDIFEEELVDKNKVIKDFKTLQNQFYRRNITLDNNAKYLDEEGLKRLLAYIEDNNINTVRQIKVFTPSHFGGMRYGVDNTLYLKYGSFKDIAEYEKNIKIASDKGICPKNSNLESFFEHEIKGHGNELKLLYQKYGYNINDINTGWKQAEIARDIVYEAYNLLDIKENVTDYFEKNISQSIYINGDYDYSEMLSEGIADCKANKTMADILSIKIKEILYNRLRG